MAEQNLLIGRSRQIAAGVADQGKLAGAIEGAGHVPADPRQYFDRRSLDAEDDQAGGRPGAQFLQHQARGIAATARQEVRHVGADFDVAEHQPCQQRRTGERDCDRTAPPVTQRFHDARRPQGGGLMVMRISSPFACIV